MFGTPDYFGIEKPANNINHVKNQLGAEETDEEIDRDITEIQEGIFSSFWNFGVDIKTRLKNQASQTDEEYDEETDEIIVRMRNSVEGFTNS